MNKSMLLIGVLVISGLLFAIALPPVNDSGVLLIRNAVKCADAPNLFKSLETQGNSFNNSHKDEFKAIKSGLSSARSTLWLCYNNIDCANRAYIPFDALMQQASALYFKAGFFGVLYNPAVMTDYLLDMATYRNCLNPIIT